MNRRQRRALQFTKAARSDDPLLWERKRQVETGEIQPTRSERRALARVQRRNR